MAPGTGEQQQEQEQEQGPSRGPTKLRRLPKTHRISKRPPLRPAVASPYASAALPKVVYVSTATPFISAVKRVEKLLALIEKRAVQSATSSSSSSTTLTSTASADETSTGLEAKVRKAVAAGRGKEEVLLKGIGKAIPAVLKVGLYFSRRPDMKIRVGTGTVETVDDIVRRRRGGDGGEPEEEDDHRVSGGAEQTKVPTTQVRQMSMVEIGVRYR